MFEDHHVSAHLRKTMASLLTLAISLGPSVTPAFAAGKQPVHSSATATPIQHLVVILQENVSFDHYFATYPNATNPICGNASTALPGLNGTANPHALGRCGYGMRQPFLVVSPWARQNSVDHSLTDQTSVIRFIEDNWLGGQRIGNGSFDSIAGSINGMFDFRAIRKNGTLFLNASTGEKE
ncbi:MAG TPA: alkaline phosphatase family protein [Terriglobales bacterium]|nr:alkaline phosphatase family protein [Terriglobales bacterium]